ncbi:ABC transporter ATP-binding protein [Planktosalinus lacus]|uniref:Xenobiotic ABC transporter ATP-binding protein n=1 Tax=Planktosalinus lacus TaxID=1526573 RepID=A0A8J2YAI7_9FLAO|nr:ABC transporter ATP-binding protein [Planktosalinus lacus]GGD91661.1 xenobiotic ABC transporter ATP-binding protein [Planktosalinus lacus]
MASTGQAFDFKLFKRLLRHTKPYNHIFWFVAIAAIVMSGLGVLRPILLQYTIDDAFTPKDDELLVYYISLMGGVLLLEVLFQFAFIYFSNFLGYSVIRDIRVKLFDKILHFKMKYFDKSSVGRLTTRAVNDLETIASVFSEGLFMIASDLLKMIVIITVMLVTSWELSLLVFAMLPIILYATRLFQKAMKVAFEDVRNQVANLNSFVQERITGMKIVHLFTRENKEYSNFEVINDKHKMGWMKTVWYNSIFFAVIEMLSSITIGIVVWYGGLQALELEGMTLGIIVMFIELVQMLFRPLRQIADKFNTLQMGMVAANRVFSILDTEASIENKGTQEFDDIKGQIKFENVYFSYDDEEMVIKGISLDVHPNQTVAIVGATGAGKSTIINLLSRFYEIKSGAIYVDGINIKDVSLSKLRKGIGVVLQDVFLFADTIMNNITLNNPDVTEEEVIQAAKDIGVHQFIMSLPDGYNYNVKERGSMLSSGQRQLIAFLRAYVSNPGILVLDEATSSVDSYSEQLIQNATEKITHNRTSIVIAHRLATIKKADVIIVMEAGEIVEMGNHKELLQIENGHYRNLYEVQFSKEKVLD